MDWAYRTPLIDVSCHFLVSHAFQSPGAHQSPITSHLSLLPIDAPAPPRDDVGSGHKLSMIRIELPTLIFIYLFLSVIVIGGLWLFDGWRVQKRKKQALRYAVRCTICASIFEDKTNELLPRCPRCGSLNERRNFGGL